jgi:hypothetical protein
VEIAQADAASSPGHASQYRQRLQECHNTQRAYARPLLDADKALDKLTRARRNVEAALDASQTVLRRHQQARCTTLELEEACMVTAHQEAMVTAFGQVQSAAGLMLAILPASQAAPAGLLRPKVSQLLALEEATRQAKQSEASARP